MIKINGYEIGEQIGEGGMAKVYLGKHLLLNQERAIKVLAMDSLPGEGFRKSFIVEGQIIARLEHPHIVKIYDISIDNNCFYMAMEYVKNGTLKERLKADNLGLQEIFNIIKQIASALSYAHSQDYIHRDIKPANILFRNSGDAVLTDFGIAKLQGTASEMTQMGFMAGTPHYMAPEQAIGGGVDGRTDQYSLAIVFFEMLTGKKPFDAENTVAITYQHAHSEVPRLRGKFSIFQSILDRALSKKKEDRFSNINTFVEAIRKEIIDDEEETIIQESGSQVDDGARRNIRVKEFFLSFVLACSLLWVYLFFFNEKYTVNENLSNESPVMPSEPIKPKYDKQEITRGVGFVKKLITDKKMICKIQRKIRYFEIRNDGGIKSDLRLTEGVKNMKRDISDRCAKLFSKNNINYSIAIAGEFIEHVKEIKLLSERDAEDFTLIFPDGYDLPLLEGDGRYCVRNCE